MVRGGSMPIARRGMLIVPGQVQLEPDAEEVPGALREVGTAVVVVALKVNQYPPAAGQSIGPSAGLPWIDTRAGTSPQAETVVLKERVARLGIESFQGVGFARIGLSALVAVVPGGVEDCAHAQRSPEADRI